MGSSLFLFLLFCDLFLLSCLFVSTEGSMICNAAVRVGKAEGRDAIVPSKK